MLIECEACQTQYEIGTDFPADGRKVKCARCEHVWQAVPMDKPIDKTPEEDTQPEVAPADQDLDIDKLVLSPPEIPPLEPESFGAIDFEDLEFQEFEEEEPQEEKQDEPDEADIVSEEEVAEPELQAEESKADEEEPLDEENKEPESEPEPEVEEVKEVEAETDQEPVEEPEADKDPVLEADSEDELAAEVESVIEDETTQEETAEITVEPEKEDPAEDSEEEENLEDWKLPAPEAVGLPTQPSKTGASRIVVMLSWLMFAGVVLSLVGGSYTYRTEVVRVLPAAADIYRLFGESINVRGLSFEEVRYEWMEKNGEPVVAVQGVVKNLTDDSKSIPRLRLAFRNANNRDIVLWSKQLSDEKIAAHQSKPFEVIVPAPPKEVQSLQILFAK